jgi:hypothetical protein
MKRVLADQLIPKNPIHQAFEDLGGAWPSHQRHPFHTGIGAEAKHDSLSRGPRSE